MKFDHLPKNVGVCSCRPNENHWSEVQLEVSQASPAPCVVGQTTRENDPHQNNGLTKQMQKAQV